MFIHNAEVIVSVSFIDACRESIQKEHTERVYRKSIQKYTLSLFRNSTYRWPI